MERTVVLAAGGSGGHMSPAVSSYEFLSRTYSVVFLTDSKGRKFLDKVAPQVPSYLIQAQSPSVKATAVWSLGIGLWQSLRTLKKLAPRVIVGFGGYATVPVLIAGFLLRVPLVIHEQNRRLGRANRLLKPIATRLALGFDIGDQSPKTRVTGNPTCFSPCQYCPPEDAIEIVVSGGSQGATRLSSTVPKAIALLSTEIKQRLSVSHQAREEDVQAVREAYRTLNVECEVRPFFTDLERRLSRSHLVISRAGASSLTEIMTIGRPAILIPYPFALDDHQRHNAEWLSHGGGAWTILESDLSPLSLSQALTFLLESPERLKTMASFSRSLAATDAVSALASLIEEAKI